MSDKFRKLFLAMSIVGTLFHAAQLKACTCVGTDPKTSFKSSAAVFLGEVVGYDGVTAQMRPLQIFKGAKRDLIEIAASPDSGACGYGWALLPGSRHLIYAADRDEYVPYLQVSLCGGSKQEKDALRDLSYLHSRAAWWRSPVSSVRILSWLRVWRRAWARTT